MTHSSLKSPMILSNIKKMDETYGLLAKRRSSLMNEMENEPRQLHTLHKAELRMLRSHMSKIENFLQRYGFIDKRSIS